MTPDLAARTGVQFADVPAASTSGGGVGASSGSTSSRSFWVSLPTLVMIVAARTELAMWWM